jgi:hypothetical protein
MLREERKTLSRILICSPIGAQMQRGNHADVVRMVRMSVRIPLLLVDSPAQENCPRGAVLMRKPSAID